MQLRLESLLKYLINMQVKYHCNVVWEFYDELFDNLELIGEFAKLASVFTIDAMYDKYRQVLGIESLMATTVVCVTRNYSLLTSKSFPKVTSLYFTSSAERQQASHNRLPEGEFMRQISTVRDFPLTVYFHGSKAMVCRHQVAFMVHFIKHATTLHNFEFLIMQDFHAFGSELDSWTLTETEDALSCLTLGILPSTKKRLSVSLKFFSAFHTRPWNDDKRSVVCKFLAALLNKWNVSVLKYDQTTLQNKPSHYKVLVA